MQYSDFDQIKEIGVGGYGTVYTAKYKKYSDMEMRETVVLKRMRNFDQTPELFISEVSNNWYNMIVLKWHNLTLYLFSINSLEIMSSAVTHRFKFMESHKTQKQKST